MPATSASNAGITLRGYDQLAPFYRTLEFLAFGRDLERTRFKLLSRLQDCRRILVFGEGDGRCLARLLAIAPEAHIDCLDISPVMLAHAKRRLPNPSARVTFQQADILSTDLPSQHYDAVITCFFLDCFTTSQVRDLINRIRGSLRSGALWLWADFVLPAAGLKRWRAKIWLTILHTFFRWQTGLTSRSLPASETELARAGFTPIESHTTQWGLLRCTLFRQPMQIPSLED